ncbi:MAG: DUF4097 domain-containing protein [Clostridia bacterium]|jgi:hypothetical protein|nr:DUF4097 domain-containing protein [Clostridia bacterium]
MERNARFESDRIGSLAVKLAWPQLEILRDDVSDIQVLTAGDEHSVSELKVYEKEGTLCVEQPAYGFSIKINSGKWLQVLIRLPASWRGAVDAGTVSGLLNAHGLTGREIRLDTVSGDLRAMAVEGVNVSFKTISGDIKLGGVTCEKLSLRTVSGDTDLQGGVFRQARATTVSGRIALECSKPFERVDVTSVSGDVAIRAPMDKVNAVLHSVSGHIHTSNVSLADNGAAVHVSGVSADLSVINTSANGHKGGA